MCVQYVSLNANNALSGCKKLLIVKDEFNPENKKSAAKLQHL